MKLEISVLSKVQYMSVQNIQSTSSRNRLHLTRTLNSQEDQNSSARQGDGCHQAVQSFVRKALDIPVLLGAQHEPHTKHLSWMCVYTIRHAGSWRAFTGRSGERMWKFAMLSAQQSLTFPED